jgi:hypothetical protein
MQTIANGHISSSHGDYEDDCLLGCCTVLSGRKWMTFQRCLLPSTSGWWAHSTWRIQIIVDHTAGLNMMANAKIPASAWSEQWLSGTLHCTDWAILALRQVASHYTTRICHNPNESECYISQFKAFPNFRINFNYSKSINSVLNFLQLNSP